MLTKKNLHNYQIKAINFILEKKKCGLFMEMGLGKTGATLTALQDLKAEGKIKRILVIAPLRVANTVWSQEIEKWDHITLTASICTGLTENRIRGLKTKADMYIINRENIHWLVELARDKKKWPFDCVVIDESSSFKSHAARRFKAMCRTLDKINYMILLTGTPSPNGLMDLWPQLYLIDKGARLGKNITQFRKTYFDNVGFGGYKYVLKGNSEGDIKAKIKDICLSMSTEDYLDMPERIDVQVPCEMPLTALDEYNKLEEQFYLELETGEIEVNSAAVMANKLLQFCNGAVYDAEKQWHVVHDVKIETLKDIVQDNPNENILLAYNFKSDLARLKEAFPDAVILDTKGIAVKKWNEGEVKMLLAHPASAGHGLNLQHGGNLIVWFGMNWSLELYQQFNARLYRQGQKNSVRILHLVANGGMDKRVLEVLGKKAKNQEELLEYLKDTQQVRNKK